jgi:hypothetical protein
MAPDKPPPGQHEPDRAMPKQPKRFGNDGPESLIDPGVRLNRS